MIRKVIALGLLFMSVDLAASVYMQIGYMQVMQRHFTPKYIEVTPNEMSRLLTKEQLAEASVKAMKGHQEISHWWAETIRLSKSTMTSLVVLALAQALLMLAMVIPSERQFHRITAIEVKGVRPSAVVAGLLTTMVAGLTAKVLLEILILSQSTYTSTHLEALEATTLFKVIVFGKSAFFAALGGYVASRLSLPKGLVNGLCLGAIIFAFGILLPLVEPPQTKLLSRETLLPLLALASAVLGGYIGTRGSSASKAKKSTEA